MKHNWEYKKWDEVLRIINGKNQKAVENPNGRYPIYGSGGLMGYADDYLCPEFCTIIGRKGSINNPIYVETKFWNVDTAFGLCAKEESLLPRYLYFFCVHYDFMKHNKATTLPSLVKADLLKIEMPVPPMDVQKQIDAELNKLNEMIATRKEQLKELDNLAQSLFYDTFGDPIMNPKGWEVKTFGVLCKLCAGGDKPADTEQEYSEEKNIPIYSNGTVNEGLYGYTSKAKIIQPSVTISGRGTIGVPFIRKKPFVPIIRLIVATPSSDIDLYFLYHIIKILKLGGNGASIPQLTVPMIKDLFLPIPPLPLQQQFATQVEAIEKQKELVEASISELQTLLDSRMDYWFN